MADWQKWAEENPGKGFDQAPQEVRVAAWEAAGKPDYNNPKPESEGGGYHSVEETPPQYRSSGTSGYTFQSTDWTKSKWPDWNRSNTGGGGSMALPDTIEGQRASLAGTGGTANLSPADRLAYLLRDPWAALSQVLQGMGVDAFSNTPLAMNMRYKAQTLPTAFILSKGPGYEWSGPESFFDFVRSYAQGGGAPGVDLRAQLRQAMQAEPGSDWYNFFRDPEHFPSAYDAAEWLANAYRAATANTYSPMHASMARRIANELPTKYASGYYGSGQVPASTNWTDWLRQNRHLLPGF